MKIAIKNRREENPLCLEFFFKTVSSLNVLSLLLTQHFNTNEFRIISVTPRTLTDYPLDQTTVFILRLLHFFLFLSLLSVCERI